MSDNQYKLLPIYNDTTKADVTDLIDIYELCEILHIGKNAAYNLLNSHEVPAFKIGRIWKIPRTSVTEYIYQKAHEHQ